MFMFSSYRKCFQKVVLTRHPQDHRGQLWPRNRALGQAFCSIQAKSLRAQQIQDCDQQEPSKFAYLGLTIVSSDAEI